MEDDTAVHVAKPTHHKSKKRLPLIATVIVAVVIIGIVVALIASNSSATNPASSSLHVGSTFKDVGKTYTGTAMYSAAKAEACVSRGFDQPACTAADEYGTEAVTLEEVIDSAQGINNTDVADPGTRFVVAKFEQKNESSITLADGVVSQASVPGASAYTANYVTGPILYGSDGQLYQSQGGTKTTANCTPFPADTNGMSATGNGLAPDKIVTGCYRYQVPTSVKISYFQFGFDNSSSPTNGPFTTVKWSSK